MAVLLLGAAAGLVVLLGLFWKFWFLRNPAREIPPGRRLLSPADGRIIEIVPLEQPDTTGPEPGCAAGPPAAGYEITIFLSIFDVHYQRAPVEGRVESIRYIPGRFFPAFSPEASQNERNEVVLLHPELGRIRVTQVAGILARRIRCFVKRDDELSKGEIFGLIAFGSRVSMRIPRLDLKIRSGQRVKAGLTVLAEY